jgi:hypothetical protein
MGLINTTVIGLVGFKQHGKGEVARALVEERGYTPVKFATPLKQALRAILHSAGLDEATIERMIEGDLKEVPSPVLGGRTPRYAMITLGTEWGRDMMASDLWTGIANHKIIDLLLQGKRVVIDDVRYPNELAVIKSLGGSIIRVHRIGYVVDTEHESERNVPSLSRDAVGVIFNEGGIDELRAGTLRLIDELLHQEVRR